MDEERYRSLISLSAGIIGSISGTALSLLGPIGAFAGAAGGVAITGALERIGNDIYDRTLSKREKERIGTAASYFIIKTNEKLQSGQLLRNDDFFEKDYTNRSSAEEILEGTLIAAQKDHEEKKLPYISNMLSNICFRNDIDRSFANLLLKEASSLSYNQFCLLKIFNEVPLYQLSKANYRGRTPSKELIPVLYEVSELDNKQLIVNGVHHVLGLTDIVANEYTAQGIGRLLYELLELKDMPFSEIERNIELLSE